MSQTEQWRKENTKLRKYPTPAKGASYRPDACRTNFFAVGVWAMSNRKQKRSTKYVNSLLQGHLMWRMAMYWFIYNGALIGVIAGGKLINFIPDMIAGRSSFSSGQFFADFMAESGTLMTAMAVFCPILIWDMLKFSHRIAGPLYRFRKTMEDHVNGGPLKLVKLRDGDLLGDFQGEFNEFVSYLHQQHPEMKQLKADATASVSDGNDDLQPR